MFCLKAVSKRNKLYCKKFTFNYISTLRQSLSCFFVTATNANISGTVNAASDKIGGLNINGMGLYFNNGNTGFGMWGTTAHDNIAIHAGANSQNIGTAPFRVYHDGKIIATKGIIAGWELDTNHFTKISSYNGVNYRVTIGSNSSEPAFGVTTNGWDNGVTFKVNWDGSLYATNANISGTIKASGGNLDAWVIGNGGMYYNNSTSGCGLVGDNRHANIAIYAGANTQNIGGAPFRVYHDGTLYASNANITGTINATSGSFTGTISANSGNIGVWKIGGNYIYCPYTSAESGVYLERSLCYLISPNGSQPVETTTNWGAIFRVAHQSSDKQLKENISPLSQGCDAFFDSLSPVSFNYINGEYINGKRGLHFGFIAQDVLKTAQTNNLENISMVWKDDYYNLNKMELIALNTWQIQKLKSRILELEKQLNKS